MHEPTVVIVCFLPFLLTPEDPCLHVSLIALSLTKPHSPAILDWTVSARP